jgi:hypothetical protein
MLPFTAQLQIASHITTWSQIPTQLAIDNPIMNGHGNGNGAGTLERIRSFADAVRSHEENLLGSLGIDLSFLGHLDRLSDGESLYTTLFWQIGQPWVSGNRGLASQVLRDMEPLNGALGRLRRFLKLWDSKGVGMAEADEAILGIGKETNFIRRHLAPRAGLARELSPILSAEPAEAILIFYDDNIRALRRFNDVGQSLRHYFAGSD